MLRSITFSIMGLLVTSTLHAQHVSFGVKAGLNASTYAGSDVPNPRFRLGPTAGLLVRLPLGQHLDLQPELLYEQRGAYTSYYADYATSSATYRYTYQGRSRLHYVSLPVLLRLHADKWFAVLGPQASYLAAAQHRTTPVNTLTSGTPDPLIATGSFRNTSRSIQPYHQWELGGVVGVGYQVLPRLAIELRYAAGFTPVQRPLNHDDFFGLGTSIEQARNSTLQAQVSYLLGKL